MTKINVPNKECTEGKTLKEVSVQMCMERNDKRWEITSGLKMFFIDIKMDEGSHDDKRQI